MSFRDKIPGCFGTTDKIFSGHPCDTNRAKELLIEALQETESWSEYENAIKVFLKDSNCNEEHIIEQMKRVKNTEFYFQK